MITSLTLPYCLSDQGFSFKLHNPQLEQVSAIWDQALCEMANWNGGIAFAFDELQSLYLLRFSNIATISVSLAAKTIDIWPEVAFDEEAIKRILIDQLIPRIISGQGALVLHAGSVVVGKNAIAFMGDTGVGKSTLVASLYLHGAPLVNDDAVVVSSKNEQFFISASHPSLRLLPDSLANLFADSPESTPISRFTSKRHIVIQNGKRHETPSFSLSALFFIGNHAVDQTSLRKLAPTEAVMTIIANSFALNPTVPEFALANLRRACALAEHVPAYELNYPRTYDALPDVHQKIFSKLDELQR